MKIRNKPKIYTPPSSPSYSSSSSSSYKDAMSVLEHQPESIFDLALSLSDQDREVLAYMITRSIPTAPSSSMIENHGAICRNLRKGPVFRCGCFECYTRFWVRWDTSPNRELIHRALESVEDQFFKNMGRVKKRNKQLGRRRKIEKSPEIASPEKSVETMAETEVVIEECFEENGCEEVKEELVGDESLEMAAVGEMAAAILQFPLMKHTGLARKVLPDVVGIFNSRFWSLWSPNI